MTKRAICVIAKEISEDWLDISDEAYPYVIAMLQLRKITDTYYLETAEDIITRFLNESSKWKSKKSRRIKKELKQYIKNSKVVIKEN